MFTLSEKKHFFEQLFRENYSRLFYYALSFVNDREVAKDVISDAFEQLWLHRGQLEFSTSLTPLLYKLVRNACVDVLRHEDTKKRFALYMSSQPEAVEEEKYAEYEGLIDRIHRAVDGLPEQTRVVFKKCFLEGKKYQEVGKEHGITINTVKNHVMRALRILRSEFSHDEFILLFFSFPVRIV